MRSSKAFVLLLTPLLAAPTTGCSFLFVDGPTARGPGSCTDSMVWPTVDYVAAGLEGVRILYAANQPESAYIGKPYSKTGDIAFGVSFLSLFVLSGLVGTTRVNECQVAMATEPDDPDVDREVRQRARQIQRQRQLREQQSAVQAPPPGATPNDAWGSPSTAAPQPAPRSVPAPAAVPPAPAPAAVPPLTPPIPQVQAPE